MRGTALDVKDYSVEIEANPLRFRYGDQDNERVLI
jgi:hypothetical protein